MCEPAATAIERLSSTFDQNRGFLVDIIGQKLVKNLTFFLKKSKKKAEKSTPTLVGEKCCSNCDLKRAFKLAKRPQV